MTVEDNKRIVLALLENWLDPDYFAEAAHDDLEFVVEADAEFTPFAGAKTKAHTIETRRRSAARFPEGVTMTVQGIVAEGDHVAVRVVAEGAVAGGDGGPGGRYHNRAHIAFELRDGRIARVHEYTDTAYLVGALARTTKHISAR